MLHFETLKTKWLRIPTLTLSAWLHLLPLMRVAVSESTVAVSPVLAIVRWFAGAAACAGAFHAVSGATTTGVTVTQGGVPVSTPIATNGLAIAGIRIAMVNSVYGAATSFAFSNLPPGLIGSVQGVIVGIPTQSGQFNTMVIGRDAAGNVNPVMVPIIVFDRPPAVVTPPSSRSVSVGDSVTFTATVTGTGLTYRWLKNDIELPAPAGTAATYVIASAKLTDAGRYKLKVSNTGGVAISAEAVLTVTPAGPILVTPPHGQEVYAGEAVTFSVAATSGSPLSYQWEKNAQIIPNATNSTLTLPSVALSDAANYAVAVTSGGTTVTSPAAVLKIDAGIDATLSHVAADGTATVSVTTTVGRSYVMEEALDLSGTWSKVGTVTATGATTSITSAASSGSRMENRFWRVSAIPVTP